MAEQQQLDVKATFIHLPLDVSQAAGQPRDIPSLPAAVSAAAIRLVLSELGGGADETADQ